MQAHERRDWHRFPPWEAIDRAWLRSMPRKILRRLKALLMVAFDASARGDKPAAIAFARILALGRDTRFRNVRRMAIEWLDECACHSKTTMLPSFDGFAHGPKIGGRQAVARVIMPPIARYEFRDACVSATSSSVLLSDRLIVERVPTVDASRGNYASGHLLAHGSHSGIVISSPEERLDFGIFLGGNGSSNYYHWLLELLPKMEFVEDTRWPLLVSADASVIGTFRDALGSVARERPVVFMDNERTYRVSHLLYVTSPTLCPFNLRKGEVFTPEDFLLRPSSIAFLRARLMHFHDDGGEAAHRRIFLARKPGRRDYNQEEVFAVFRDYGFENVHMEDLSLCEQIDTVRGANMIAGPTGAAWTNLLFARPGTRCLCWMAEEQSGFAGYSNLAHAVGADLHYVTYRTGFQDTRTLYSLNYRLDPTAVAREMKQLAG